MNLEEFEVYLRELDTTAGDSLSTLDALKWVDAEWHTASRQARWMDLLGDYAGTEPFIIDGNSLIQLVIDDPLLALGKPNDPSFQILHAFHQLERTLNEFIKRSAVFDVVFWEETRHIALRTGVGAFENASRSLARKLLFNHLLKIPEVAVYIFTSVSDSRWRDYLFLRKPVFVLINDGSSDQDLTDPFTSQRLLCHRVFLFDLLTRGVALALFDGAEFRDSKVLSFVYESRSHLGNEYIPSPVHAAYSTAARALKERSEDTSLISLTTSIDPIPLLKVLPIEDVIPELTSLVQFSGDRKKALFFAFLLHLLLLPRLSAQDRARRLETMRVKFKNQLISDFLPTVFRAMETSITSFGTAIDVDVRVFIALVRFLAENPTLSVQDIFGNKISRIVKDRLFSFSVPISAFRHFSANFIPVPEPPSSSVEDRLGLLPFSNKIFDDELAPIRGLTEGDGAGVVSSKTEEDAGLDSEEGSNLDEWDTDSEEEEEDRKAPKSPVSEMPSTGYFDDGTLYNDTRYWHNHKKDVLPKHLGDDASPPRETDWQRMKKLRSDQRFMKTLHDQAATLTGASGATLHQIKILPVGAASAQPSSKKQSYVRPSSTKATHKQSKADIIREQNLERKAQKRLAESTAWLAECVRDLDSQRSMSAVEKSLSDLKRNPKSTEPFVAVELALYRLHRAFQEWISDFGRESTAVRDKHTVAALRTIKDILEINYSTNDIRKCVQDILHVMGFASYTSTLTPTDSATPEDRPLTFKFVKLVKSKTQEPLHAFMRIQEHPIEWQLRVFGEYMDQSMDSQTDPRVPFKPDAWQRQVLDAIDENKSLLVVAPTSAGKTFISYYAMEKVLRGSDEGVIVYIAPTKALVSQVAAEVYARFSKDLHGRSCWSIHTRDYRIHDPQNCQILVTVPEMLAIMMLLPPLAKAWMPHLKYIILDEIHSIGQQEGGSVWEQILLLAPCPVIGLSATVGEPEKFNTWLEAVQKAGGFQHTFIHHRHRYSHLRKFFYNLHKKPTGKFDSISTYKSTGRMRFLHPIAMLAFGPRSIPSDLTLEAADTLTLYRALVAHGSLPSSTVKRLNPKTFFPSGRLLQQKDVIAYEEALKKCLEPMVAQFDPRDTAAPLYKVITSLEDRVLHRSGTETINSLPTRDIFAKNLLHLVCDLHAQGDLPAIFFNLDGSSCESMARTLHNMLVSKEKRWRATNPEWKRKLTEYDEWLSRAKDRERAAAQEAKKRIDPKDAKRVVVEWQATFDPNAPLPEFSFVGQRTSYTQGMLEEELENLERWTKTPMWALLCLRRGIAVHHAGMNKRYRTIIESLFRQGFIRVIFATDTLALGINAPTKTSVFCGDSPLLTALSYRQCAGRAGRRGYDLLGKVVFYGLPMDRVQRLTLSKLPSLGANFRVTSTLILRLFNLLESSDYAPAAVSSVQRLVRLPQISFGLEGKHQLLYHLRFSIDYLRRARLLNEQGRPFNLFGIASQLYYTEPSNFALVALLRHGVFHRICAQRNVIQAKRDFVILMSHLFGRRYLPGSYLKSKNMEEIIKRSGSMVVLPPLSNDARRVLVAHEEEILRIFTGYALTYGSQHNAELGPDIFLPLSGIEFCGTTSDAPSRFVTWLQETTLRVVARSLFVANSGHDDQFRSVTDLMRTARRGLNLNEHAIPSFAPIFATSGHDGHKSKHRNSGHPHIKHHTQTRGFALNAYILDFYTHGRVKALSDANAIRRGEVWFVLEEFALTLMTMGGVLERLIMRKRGRVDVDIGEGENEDRETEDLDSGFIDVDDPTEKGDEGEDEDERKGKRKGQTGLGHVKPSWVSERDWKVLKVAHEVTTEFDEKFKAMWA